MLDPVKEAQDLKKADADIRRGIDLVLVQERIVRQLIARDHDPTHAQELLRTMRDALDVLDGHRSQIMRNLADLEEDERANGAQAGAAPNAPPSGPFDLVRAQELLDEYRNCQRLNQAARQEMMGGRLQEPVTHAVRAHLLALNQGEHDALRAYLDEMARCSAECDWENAAAGVKRP